MNVEEGEVGGEGDQQLSSAVQEGEVCFEAYSSERAGSTQALACSGIELGPEGS